ncbi:type VII secretion-associated serine protease mycosin [Streptomyces sp. NBC_00133]|uniref:type VII secretion-associated serine protease mycosin n=1 Tax=Streptomyces sp. NBC_00133 TaxID=2903624 RepID=UPI003251B47C
MPTSSIRSGRRRAVVSGVLGLLLVGIAATPAHADTVRSRQWHLYAMKADEIWKISTGKGMTVAVIDSGVDDTLPDLKGQVLKGKNYSSMVGDENNDIADHGTGIATLIAGTGGRGATTGSFGLAPGAKILPIRMPYADEKFGPGDPRKEYAQKMSEAIRYAADSPAQIINISMGQRESGSDKLTQAVKYALDKNKLIFAAVGNTADEGNAPEYPAATPGVVGVGGVDKTLNWWNKSQTGTQVDFVAPAVKTLAACSPTLLCDGDGTSNATALASASAALVWSKHRDWTNNQILKVLLNTAGGAANGAKRTDFIGYGGVRPRVALKTPGDPGPADEYPLPDLAAAAPKSPSPQPSKAAAGGVGSDKRQPDAAPSASKDGSNTSLWIALGIGAAVLIGAAVAVPLIRSRRRAAAALAQASTPPYQQQPSHPAYGPPQTGPSQSPPYPGPPGPGQL